METVSIVPAVGAGRAINKGKKHNSLIDREQKHETHMMNKYDNRARKFNVVHQSEYRFNQDLKINDNSFASNKKGQNKRMINVMREDAMLIPQATHKKKNINTLNNFMSGASCQVEIDRSLLPPSEMTRTRTNAVVDEPQFYRKV